MTTFLQKIYNNSKNDSMSYKRNSLIDRTSLNNNLSIVV